MCAEAEERKEDAPLRLLLLEDDEIDAQWVKRSLQHSKTLRYVVSRGENLEQALALLKNDTFDIILSDLKVPDAFGLEIYEAFAKNAPGLPIILWTGNVLDEGVAIEAVKRGAQDYLIKGQVDERGLLRALAYANERKKLIGMRDHFVNVVSHELRNPLFAILELVRIVHGSIAASGPQDQKNILEMVMKSISRLFRITDDLLAIAKLEAGKAREEKTLFNINEVVREVAGLFEELARKKGLQLKTSFFEEVVEVYADKDNITRVFTNMLSNALKFCQEGFVEISVSGSGEDAGVVSRIRAAGSLRKSWTRFSVNSSNSANQSVAEKRGPGWVFRSVKRSWNASVERSESKANLEKAPHFSSPFPRDLRSTGNLARSLRRRGSFPRTRFRRLSKNRFPKISKISLYSSIRSRL